jgi:hypothetical protein
MAIENNNLERKIKEALESLTPEYDPTSWEGLEQRISAEEILNPSDDSLIDDLAIQNLAGLSAGSNADWSLFENKLDASEAAVLEEVDQLAYDNLSRFEAPYQPSHWELMMKRIEAELTLRGKLYRYKVGEVALMLLLIFTFFNLQPLDHFPIKIGGDKEKSEIELNNAGEVISTQNNLIPQSTDGTKEEKISRPIAANGNSEIENPKVDFNSNTDKERKEEGTLQNTFVERIDKASFDRESPNTPLALPALSPFVTSEHNFSLADNLMNYEKESSMVPMINSLIALEISLLDFEGEEDFELNEPKKVKVKPDWRISIFSTSDINKVYTPFDVTFGNPAYTSIAGGYGGGITATMKLNRIAFETGGLYSFKRYIPEPFSDEPFKPNSLFTQDFKGVQLDLLQIPVNFQYHVKNRGKLRFYVNAGASVHMLLSPVYEVERTWLAPPMAAPLEGGCDTCIENIKEFPKGILDGGSFKDNAYGTLNVGFGIERYLNNNRWSVFVQPTYQHYITKEGVGPNEDKIYSISFLLGTKVSLK